jgi:hypothetical protein
VTGRALTCKVGNGDIKPVRIRRKTMLGPPNIGVPPGKEHKTAARTSQQRTRES